VTRMASHRSRELVQICALQAERVVLAGDTRNRRTRHALSGFERTSRQCQEKAGLLALFPGADLPPKTMFSAQVYLTRVLDLSTNETRGILATNSAELAQPWKARKEVATQELGLACFGSRRFSALRYRSTKGPPSYCLSAIQ